MHMKDVGSKGCVLHSRDLSLFSIGTTSVCDYSLELNGAKVCQHGLVHYAGSLQSAKCCFTVCICSLRELEPITAQETYTAAMFLGKALCQLG